MGKGAVREEDILCAGQKEEEDGSCTDKGAGEGAGDGGEEEVPTEDEATRERG